jgi:NTP pyrophosphatase (non-canonical NTP hydrolase)
LHGMFVGCDKNQFGYSMSLPPLHDCSSAILAYFSKKVNPVRLMLCSRYMPLPLSEHPTLPEYQQYLKQAVIDQGFEDESLSDLFMLFQEECGEFAKACRKTAGLKSGAHSKDYNPGHEAADVFIYLTEICNKMGIDLETAIREKNEINQQRYHKST